MPYEAILFDFDGVLIDSEPVHFECWREVLVPHGVKMDWAIYRAHCIGISDHEMIEFLAGFAEPPAAVADLWAEYARKNKKFVDRVITAPPIPAATRTLLSGDLAAYKLAVVSSSGRAEVEPILVAGGIRDLFQVVVCGDDVENFKPHPEPYIKAARLLGVASALVVEDSEPGEESGRAAGFDVVRVDSAERTAELVLEQIARKS